MAEQASGHASRAVLGFFGHHKCASTWIWQILESVGREMGMRHALVVDQASPQSTGPLTDYSRTFERSELRQHVEGVRADIVSCITADRAQAEILRPVRAIHVIRDPRDIVVSAYFSHRFSHPTDGLPHLAEHRARLQEATPEEGLLLEMDFSACELRQLGDWDYGQDGILELKMETLIVRPYESMLTIFGHLDVLSETDPELAVEHLRIWSARLRNRLSTRRGLARLRNPTLATGEMVLGAAYRARFEALTKGRNAGETDVGSHYRKGVGGDWVNHFTPDHVDAFRERYGDLVDRLGYVEDPRISGGVPTKSG